MPLQCYMLLLVSVYCYSVTCLIVVVFVCFLIIILSLKREDIKSTLTQGEQFVWKTWNFREFENLAVVREKSC